MVVLLSESRVSDKPLQGHGYWKTFTNTITYQVMVFITVKFCHMYSARPVSFLQPVQALYHYVARLYNCHADIPETDKFNTGQVCYTNAGRKRLMSSQSWHRHSNKAYGGTDRNCQFVSIDYYFITRL